MHSTRWICSNMEMENQLVTTLKINCKAHGNGKGKGILDNLPLELTLNVMFFSTPKSLQN